MTASVEVPAELEFRFADGTSLNAMGWNTLPNGDQVHVQAQAKGSSFGNPVPLRRALRTAMLDGSRSALDGHDNRTFPLALRVTGPDGNALAGVETPLFMLAKRPAELVWRPGDLASEAAVFVLDYADLHRDEDPDFGDEQLVRDYTLQVAAQPFTYSEDYVTIPAVAQGSSTPTLVDDCGSLTGWTATDATLSTVSSLISATVASGTTSYKVTRTGAVDLTTEKYLSVLVTLRTQGSLDQVEAKTTAGAWETLPQAGTDAGALIFDGTGLTDPTVEALRFTLSKPLGSILNDNGGIWAAFDKIRKQTTPRSSASRQQVRTLEVPGSARTPASLLVSSATAGLGTVFLYTGPSYDPTWSRGAGTARTTAASFMSGGYDQLDSQYYDRPAAELPAGDYSIYARINALDASTTGTLVVQALVMSAAGAILATEDVAEVALSFSGTAQETKLLGSTILPTMTLPDGSPAKVRLWLTWTPTVGLPVGPDRDIRIDELMTFNRTLGALTIAEAGTNKKLWADSATLATDRPVVYVGDGDKADAVPLSLLSQLPAWPGEHEIEAPVTYIYAGATGASDAEVSGTFRPAWFLHPAV